MTAKILYFHEIIMRFYFFLFSFPQKSLLYYIIFINFALAKDIL